MTTRIAIAGFSNLHANYDVESTKNQVELKIKQKYSNKEFDKDERGKYNQNVIIIILIIDR